MPRTYDGEQHIGPYVVLDLARTPVSGVYVHCVLPQPAPPILTEAEREKYIWGHQNVTAQYNIRYAIYDTRDYHRTYNNGYGGRAWEPVALCSDEGLAQTLAALAAVEVSNAQSAYKLLADLLLDVREEFGQLQRDREKLYAAHSTYITGPFTEEPGPMVALEEPGPEEPAPDPEPEPVERGIATCGSCGQSFPARDAYCPFCYANVRA